jgi:hypothetical protein
MVIVRSVLTKATLLSPSVPHMVGDKSDGRAQFKPYKFTKSTRNNESELHFEDSTESDGDLS